MNVEKNPKTFNYLFTLFIEMGENELGRQLSNDELSKIKSSIINKCANISKKDIVKEIYKLELARNESQYGHLGIRERFALKKLVAAETNCPVKFTSSSDELARIVAAKFSRIELSDKYKDTTLTSPKSINEKHSKLKNSYVKDTFHYTAPLNTKEKLKRLAILGIATLSFASIVAGANNVRTIDDAENTSISTEESSTQETSDTTVKLEDTVDDDLLQDFKNRYAAEYNLAHGQHIIDSWDLKIRQISHTYLYKVKTLDANGKETYKYMTKANPTETEAYLDSHGYEYETVSNFNNDIPVISAVNSEKTELYDAYAYIDGKCVSIIDGSYPEKLKETDNLPNVLYNMRQCFSELTRNPSRRSVYIDYLKKYYSNTPKHALYDNIIFELDSGTLEK